MSIKDEIHVCQCGALIDFRDPKNANDGLATPMTPYEIDAFIERYVSAKIDALKESIVRHIDKAVDDL